MLMNFGMTNALSTFVTLMNNIFKPLLGKCVNVYLNNIIVFSKTKSQQKEDLKEVLQTLWENQLFQALLVPVLLEEPDLLRTHNQ